MLSLKEEALEISRYQTLDARDAWVQWLSTIDWDLFVTLTFDRHRFSFTAGPNDNGIVFVRRLLFSWRRRSQRLLRCPLFFVFTLEWRGDWPHLHGLISGVAQDSVNALRNAWWLKGGLAHITPTAPGTTSTVASYMFKDWDQPGFDIFTTTRFS